MTKLWKSRPWSRPCWNFCSEPEGASRWGAGRDVWALPAISLSSESLVIAPVERNGRLAGYEVKDSLSVRDIIRDEEGILAMVLVNQSGKVLKWEARR